jgi:hypothetical protein
VVALACLAIGAGTVGGVARADPSTSTTLTYHFTDCSGPAGTPTTFDAVKQPSESAALQLTSGSGTFVLIEAVDVATGATLFTTPGFVYNNLATITCSLIHPVTGQHVLITGFIAPVG